MLGVTYWLRSELWYSKSMDETQVAKLVQSATDLVNEYGDDKNHTMAAAVLTKSGKIFTSLNFYHFTGGPDAEVAALARVVSEGESPVTVVAVGHNDRGVMAPCGRCRQTIFDYYPDMQVVLPGNNVKSIKELLPDTFDWNEQQ